MPVAVKPAKATSSTPMTQVAERPSQSKASLGSFSSWYVEEMFGLKSAEKPAVSSLLVSKVDTKYVKVPPESTDIGIGCPPNVKSTTTCSVEAASFPSRRRNPPLSLRAGTDNRLGVSVVHSMILARRPRVRRGRARMMGVCTDAPVQEQKKQQVSVTKRGRCNQSKLEDIVSSGMAENEDLVLQTKVN